MSKPISQDSQIITIEQQKDIFAKFTHIVRQIDEDSLSDTESEEVQHAQTEAQFYTQALFFGSHFKIHSDKPEFGSFHINPPQPFDYDSLWEEWVRPELGVLQATWEYSDFYSETHLEDTDAQIKRHLALFKTLLAMGSSPNPDSFGYAEWLAQVPMVDGKPKFEKQERMNNYFYELYQKEIADIQKDIPHKYKDKNELSGYCPWDNKKEEISAQLTEIVKNNIVLNLQNPHVYELFTTGDIYKVSAYLDVLAERKKLDKNISLPDTTKTIPTKLKKI